MRGFGRFYLLSQLSLLGASYVSPGQVMDGGARLMLASPDIDFLMRSVQSSWAEVRLGKLASQRAQDPNVRSFGQRMVEDHSKMIDELRNIAKQRTMTLSDILKASDQNEALQLSKLSDGTFDTRYIKWAIRNHKTFAKRLRKEAKSGKDEAIRGFADKTLLVTQQHLDMVQSLAGKR